MINKFQSELLLNKLYEFKSKLILNENNFGNLVVTNDYFPKEDRLKGTIKFEIDEFKSFKYEKCNRYDRDWCVINNTRWIAGANIEECENYIPYLSFFVHPNGDDVKSPIKTIINYKLLTKDGTLYDNETLEYTFKDKTGAGFNKFCSLKEIFDEKNGIYDKVKDSIKIEIDIQVI